MGLTTALAADNPLRGPMRNAGARAPVSSRSFGPRASRMRGRILRRLAGAALLGLPTLFGLEASASRAGAEEAVTFPGAAGAATSTGF